jgi:hypothetical protein
MGDREEWEKALVAIKHDIRYTKCEIRNGVKQ